MRPLALAVVAVTFAALSLPTRASVMVNEIDYDQIGVDNAEFIELAGTAGTNLSGYTLVLVNGADNSIYSINLLPSFTFSDETSTGWGFFVLGRIPAVPNTDFDLGADNSVQNGSPDGMYLLSPSSSILQFVAYGGSMPGVTDLVPAGIHDDNIHPDLSIYKTGTGSSPNDFTWVADATSPGTLNPGETLIPEPASVAFLLLFPLFTRRRQSKIASPF